MKRFNFVDQFKTINFAQKENIENDIRIRNAKLFIRAHLKRLQFEVPKAAIRRVAMTPPPRASRRSGGGGVTAYMPGKLVVESGRERKELKTGSVKRKSARGRMGVGGKRREGKPSKRKSLTPKGMKQRRAGGSAHKHSSQPSKPSQRSERSQRSHRKKLQVEPDQPNQPSKPK